MVERTRTRNSKDFENLYTVDVLCHGVPSPMVWKKYIDEQESKFASSIRKVFFRSKNQGWKNYCVKIEFVDGKIYEKPYIEDEFMRLFLADICLRPSCYDCQFKKFPRVSDMTLGDCWGVEKHSPEMDDDQGTSAVIVHTEKGKEVWKELKKTCTWKKSELDVALPRTADSRKSVKEHFNRKKFFKILRKNGCNMNELIFMTKITLLDRIKRKIGYNSI